MKEKYEGVIHQNVELTKVDVLNLKFKLFLNLFFSKFKLNT